MITAKTKDIDEPGVKSKFDGEISPKKSKLGGVKRCFLMNNMPKTPECGAHIEMGLEKLQPWDLPGLMFSCDMKVNYTLCGKEYQQSGKHNCYLCTGSSPFLEEAELVSIGFLKQCHANLIAAGKRARPMDHQNVKSKVLLKFDDKKLTIDIFAIPILHILLGVVDKMIVYIKIVIGQNGDILVKAFLASINVTHKYYQGKESLAGNDCRKIMKHINKFKDWVKTLPIKQAVHVHAAIRTLNSFTDVVTACFGNRIQGDYKAAIKIFSGNFRYTSDQSEACIIII